MRTKNFDPNEEFAYREKFCKRGISPDTTAYLPIKRPPFYKRRIAELYAKYKMYPVGMRTQQAFPELGLCIVFIPFTHSLLGRYDNNINQETKKYFARMINEKALKRRK